MPDFKHFPLPDVGEGLVEAEILTWHVQVGSTVKVNDIFVEIETSKAAVELPAPYEGVVTELLAQPGETVAVGTPIIVFDVDPGGAAKSTPDSSGGGTKIGEESADGRIQSLVGYGPKTGAAKRRARKGSAPAPVAPAPIAPAPVAAAPVVVEPEPVPEPEPVATALPGGYVPLAKPPVRKLAKDLGVDLRQLAVAGQVITRDDVERAAAPATAPEAPAVVSSGERERRVPVRGVRKATAKAMVDSAFTAPHVTEFMTIDVTPMMELRARLKNHPRLRDVKLTPLTFAAKAVLLAMKRTPDINAVWAGDEIVYKSYVHLGIAAATPRGLVVPKVHDADQLSLRELAQALEALTDKARAGKTTPAEMANGTFTITNIGVFGVDTGTPIINPGESAILALGTIRDMPWVVDGQVVPRKICQLSLSFDHRVIDGQQGSEFLADVGALLADPSIAITY
ncbi:dihydrolipoamide acetyltransferase family protein [Kibdelosporangium phytohabitans]|uniref:Dihydrolipoamide acetyltransferase component of pyruvate dehydrogenase complex n=1 Tax=Kibdelosporangium phytohabitans TaxID=860235 RepID=A0A0N7F5I7_9PSEU|nr:dihydrolipoamide acetyltransferase family protein [Kibdelosporangium phytohabitans]ALG14343.1 branched-chain alpha-keto acid dehydrogenase subunit E2 [Kibdelosporangium phytohabitans]MBE1466634.1 pyruvate dehydrogenase E2 component (dihydrolipoamide acetyltransferase) [Kibdelosporangium phytohabitans]